MGQRTRASASAGPPCRRARRPGRGDAVVAASFAGLAPTSSRSSRRESRTVRTATSAKPAARSASATSRSITSMAGQPEYVGVTTTVTWPRRRPHVPQDPRSSMVRTGTSGSSTGRGRRRTPSPPRRVGAVRRSPRSRVRAVQVLHLGEQVAHGLGVHAATDRRRVARSPAGTPACLAHEHPRRRRPSHSAPQRLGSTAMPAHEPPLELVGHEQLGDVGPDRSSPACIRRCDSSVPSPRRSIHCVAWSRW